MATATVSRSLNFTFGPGQAPGVDNVTAAVTRELAADPLAGGEPQVVTSPVTLQLPSDAWTEDDFLIALHERYPGITFAWETPAPEPEPTA
jgi:hypothetical protein